MLNELLILVLVGLGSFIVSLVAYSTRNEKSLIERGVSISFLVSLGLVIILSSLITLSTGGFPCVISFLIGAILGLKITRKTIIINMSALGILLASMLSLNFGFGALTSLLFLVATSLYQTLNVFKRKFNLPLVNLTESSAFTLSGILFFAIFSFTPVATSCYIALLAIGWLTISFSKRIALLFQK